MRVNLGNRCPIFQRCFCCQKNAENTSCRYVAFSHNLACVHNICIQTEIIVCWPRYFFMGGGTLKGVRKNSFLVLTHICLKRNLTIVRKSLELKKISPATSLKSMMNAKLAKQWPCFENQLMKRNLRCATTFVWVLIWHLITMDLSKSRFFLIQSIRNLTWNSPSSIGASLKWS